MRKKAISLVMVLAMVLSLMPTFALAADTASTGSGSATNVAKIGTTEYTTLEEAIGAVKDNETIKLTADTVTLTKYLTANRGITFSLDLNGKTLTNSNTNGSILFITNGRLTLKDSASTKGKVAATAGLFYIKVTSNNYL